MSRPITPVSGAYGSVPAHPESSISARPAFSNSVANSHRGSAAPGPSGFDHSQGAPKETSILSQSADMHEEGLEASHLESSPDVPRSESRMSQSQLHTPSRGGTLKKKASLKRTGSLGKTPSRRSSYAGSVRSMKLGEQEKHIPTTTTEPNNSAFFCPVPTSGNPTELLAARFGAWRKVLKDLINYFRDLSNGHNVRSKAMMSTSNTINNTSMPSNFMSHGGLGEAALILRDFHKQGIIDATKARDVENEIVMQLTGLRSDLQQKIKEIKGLSGDFKNAVDKEQGNTKRSVQSLQEALGSVDHDAAAVSGKGDPYIIKLGVDKQLEKQLEEENYLHRAYLNLEASGRELESIVVGEIQKAYNAFAAILRREADEAYETSEKLKEGPLAMSKDHEWDTFTTNNSQMVNPKVQIRKLEQITYPGKDHPAATEVKSGMLERKSKYLKNYTPGWYVLSPTHLHEFKSADRIASQAPVMSLYLPEQKLGSHSEPGSSSHKFMLKGRQSGSAHRAHSWVFRAESHDTMMAWFADLKELTEKTGEARNAFVRRTHARSMSGNSLKSIGAPSSNDGMEEDEADKVPYSSEQSVRGPSVSAPAGEGALDAGLGASAIHDMEDNRSEAGWRPPQRPVSGGRFPSDVNIARGLQAPQSPSSGVGYEGHDEDHDLMMAAGSLPGSGIPFTNSSELHTELQSHQATMNNPGNDMAGAAGSAAPGTTETAAPVPYVTTHPHAQRAMQAQQAGHQYGDFRHPPTAPVTAVTDGISQYGEWMAPMVAGTAGAAGGAILGATGAHHFHDRHEEEQKPTKTVASSTYSEAPVGYSEAPVGHSEAPIGYSEAPFGHSEVPIENVENSERQMEASSAVPAYGTSSPAIALPVVASVEPIHSNTADDVEPERSLSRPRGITESTMATTGTRLTTAPTLGASSGYGESLSTVPTSVEGVGEREPSMLVSGGTWEKQRVDDIGGAADSGVGMGVLGNGHDAETTIDDTELVKGANGTNFIPDRPKPLSTKSVQTISDLHVPGEFPKGPTY